MKKILLLGGTRFIGRNLVESLLQNPSYQLHLFNRGISNPNLFKNITHFTGDRNNPEDLKIIDLEYWDIIIDLSCYFPQSLKQILTHLKGKIGLYIFVSSILAYDVEKNIGINETIKESYPLKPCNKAQSIDQSNNSYGPRKAECERILEAETFLKSIILSPCITFGKYNHYQRFYYWLYKIKTQDKIILPENGKDISTYTFVDDLVKVILNCIETNVVKGKYNVSTHKPISLKEITSTIASSLNKNPEFISIDSATLKKNKVIPRVDIPLWNDGDHFKLDNTKVKQTWQFTFTTFHNSIIKTIPYYLKANWPKCSYGLSYEKEIEIINHI